MPRDAEATKRRLLDAAAAEFAERGIAGARIDRIAAAAGANKALIYTYFGNKDDLFDAVFTALVVDTVHDVPIDVDDLPAYAGRLFDRNLSHPLVLRLAIWRSLERDEGLAAAATADRFPAEDLLAMITGLSVLAAPYLAATDDLQRRRRSVTEAVRMLTEKEKR
jgi:AcrR family transcriptional regulator